MLPTGAYTEIITSVQTVLNCLY